MEAFLSVHLTGGHWVIASEALRSVMGIDQAFMLGTEHQPSLLTLHLVSHSYQWSS